MVVAAVSQNSDVIDSIIGLGADINAANKMGFTPLMFAAAYNTPEMVQYILNQGADPLVISLTGDVNTLHIAAYLNPNPDIIDVLIDAGLAIEEPMLNGDTALLLASEENTNIEVVERLVEFGADVSVFNADGVTPLGFITQRLGNRGKRFNEISDEMNERVLQSLALTEAAQ
jgi:ankyrin repeat protein